MDQLRSQSVEEFHRNAADTLRRLRETARAELLTVDGEPEAVVLSLKAYRALAADPGHDDGFATTDVDVDAIKASLQDIEAGRVFPIDESPEDVRRRLLARAAAQNLTVRP